MSMSVRERNLSELLDKEIAETKRLGDELESVYAHIRALASGELGNDRAWNHACVGLLPEAQEMEPEVKARMREKGLGHLIDRADDLVRETWSQYGFGASEGGR